MTLIQGGKSNDGNVTGLDLSTVRASNGTHLYAFDASNNKTNYLVEAVARGGGIALGSGNFANPAPAFDQAPDHNQTTNRNVLGAHDASAVSGVSDIRNDIIGGSVYPAEPELTAADGDTVPSETTHIRTTSGLFLINPQANGLISGLTSTSAVIGGTNVSLLSVTSPYYEDEDNLRVLKNQILGDRPYGSTAQRRDGYVVLRNVIGDSNCHGFADSTVIEPTDAGTYGAFDVTTTMRSSGAVDHTYAYQCRNNYDGVNVNGTLSKMGGVYVNMSAANGTINNLFGVEVNNITSSTTIVKNNIGIDIKNLTSTDNSFAVKIYQQSGSSLNSFSIFSDGTAQSYHKGVFNFGTYAASVPYPICYTHTDNAQAGLGADAGNGAYLATPSNIPISFFANGEKRLSILDAGGGFLTVNPRANADTYLGVIGFSYKTVYLDTAPVITSDERYKTEIVGLDATLKAVGQELKSKIGVYTLLRSAELKNGVARKHIGIGAQTVMSVFAEHGLDALDYGVVCYAEWEAEHDKEGNVTREAGNQYSIRYDELICLILGSL